MAERPVERPLPEWAGPAVVERLVRDDGRRVLYYTWPEPDGADDAAGGPGPAAAPDGPRGDPWSPESGPADV